MASAKRRASGRYTALYYPRPGGSQLTAGTYDTYEQALEVAQRMESWKRSGSTGLSPEEKATMTIDDYAQRWLQQHRVERSTKDGYSSALRAHILPSLGHVRVGDLQREQVRAFLAGLVDEKGLAPASQKSIRSCLSAMMQTAWDDGYRNDNPARGVRVEKNSRKKIIVMTTDQFGSVYWALPNDGARLLSDTIVSTGCRQGEAFAMKVSDLDVERSKVWFQRGLQEVSKERHGQRFFVRDTKTHDVRDVTIHKKLLLALVDWIAANNLGPDDYLFPRSLVLPIVRRRRRAYVELTDELVATLGTVTATNGQEYQHGTWNAYITAKCRCDYCSQGFANYRAERDAKRSNPRAVVRGKGGDFLDKSTWRKVFIAACVAAELPFMPTAYQLRHTHASWLIEEGVDPKKVMHRLGHGSLATTSLYTHMVHGSDDGDAADVMDAVSGW